MTCLEAMHANCTACIHVKLAKVDKVMHAAHYGGAVQSRELPISLNTRIMQALDACKSSCNTDTKPVPSKLRCNVITSMQNAKHIFLSPILLGTDVDVNPPFMGGILCLSCCCIQNSEPQDYCALKAAFALHTL